MIKYSKAVDVIMN